jgi:Peptidase S24-like
MTLTERTLRELTQMGLATEVLSRFGEMRFIAQGGSMVPAIYPGDQVTVCSTSVSNVRAGEIVLCAREGRFWLHRLTRTQREGGVAGFFTQGDALPAEDRCFAAHELVGRVVSVVRHGRDLPQPNHATSFASRISRWATRHIPVFADTLLRLHAWRWRASARQTVDSLQDCP